MKNVLRIIIIILLCVVIVGGIVMATRPEKKPTPDDNTQVEQPVPDESETPDEPEQPDEPNTPNEPEQPDEPVVTEYNITFVADGETVSTAKYVDDTTEITVPEVPDKIGYTGTWETYELNGGDKTVNAVYEAITYTITYHACQVSTSSEGVVTVTEDYKGDWSYWSQNSRISNLNLPTEYTIESDEISVATLPTSEFNLNNFTPSYKVCGVFSSWYLDAECTIAFDGTIPAGSTGNLDLYAKWTTTAVGPY